MALAQFPDVAGVVHSRGRPDDGRGRKVVGERDLHHSSGVDPADRQRRDRRGVSPGMKPSTLARPLRAPRLLAFVLLLASAASVASPASAVNVARTAVCAPGVRGQLKETSALDGVAGRLRRGDSLHSALANLPARPAFATTMHLVGLTDDHAIATAVAGRFCRDLADPRLSEIGVASSGRELWIVVVAPLDVPVPGEQPAVAREVLARVNEARAAGHRCGTRSSPPDPRHCRPDLQLVDRRARALDRYTYARAASEHHGLPDGSLPADRVRRSGSRGLQLVGERHRQRALPNAAGSSRQGGSTAPVTSSTSWMRACRRNGPRLCDRAVDELRRS